MKVQNTELKTVQGDLAQLDVEAVACPEGSVFAQGQFKAKTVIRVATLNKRGKTDERILRLACRKIFEQVDVLNISAIGLPAISFLKSDFPRIGVAKIMAQETMRYLKSGKPTTLREIVFCLDDAQMLAIFEKNLIGYIRHVEEYLGKGPYLTADAIIELKNGIVLIERSNPPYGWALPGGFVDCGESLEHAVQREVREETGLMLVGFQQFHVYSDPKRDPRFHTVTTVFVGKGLGKPRAGDDAQALKIVAYSELLKGKYAFDHKDVIKDYLKWKKAGRTWNVSKKKI